MEAFLVSTGVVALGEMGDKTQLLAIILAARFRKPLPIILGILVGGQLIGPNLSPLLLGFDFPWVITSVDSPPEAAIASMLRMVLS